MFSENEHEVYVKSTYHLMSKAVIVLIVSSPRPKASKNDTRYSSKRFSLTYIYIYIKYQLFLPEESLPVSDRYFLR